MRALHCFAVLLFCLTAAQAAPSIRVQSGDWGAASPQDIEAVLNSVAEVLLPDFPQQANVRIDVSPSASGPRVLAAKAADGAHRVLLNVRDARWDQFAYQFSHELCHIVSNYDHREVDQARPHQWVEETMCEAVALVTLERLTVRWSTAAPHRGWERYAPAFRAYAERVSRERASNPYLQGRSERRLAALLDFARSPDALPAIGYMNLAPAGDRLADYLAAWYECCPPSQRALVRRLIAVLV